MEKVAHGFVKEVGNSITSRCVKGVSPELMRLFENDEKVVVIPEAEYDRLKRIERRYQSRVEDEYEEDMK